MSDALIRASLDQSLLALADLEAGDPAAAQARGLIAQAIALSASGPVDRPGPLAGGPSRGGKSVADRWRDEIELLALAPPADAEPLPIVDLPVIYRDESPAQRRRRERQSRTDA